MNKIFRLFFLLAFAWGGLTTSAQTLNQAKKWYEEGDYEKAKPVFARFVKFYPNNGNYNLWYGICCLKTGDAAGAIPILIDNYKEIIENIDAKIERETTRLALWEQREKAKYSRLDTLLTQLNQQMESNAAALSQVSGSSSS